MHCVGSRKLFHAVRADEGLACGGRPGKGWMVNHLGSARASSVSEDILMIASGTTSVPPPEQTSSPPALELMALGDERGDGGCVDCTSMHRIAVC